MPNPGDVGATGSRAGKKAAEESEEAVNLGLLLEQRGHGGERLPHRRGYLWILDPPRVMVCRPSVVC